MSNDEINNLRLEQLKHDLTDNLIPKSKTFTRHFVLHSLDLLGILNTLFKTKNTQQLPKSSIKEKVTSEEDTQKHMQGDNESHSAVAETEPGGSLGPTMQTKDEVPIEREKWKKQLKKMLANPNISDKDKAEMVVEELDKQRTYERIMRERRLIPPHKRLLGGAYDGTESTQSSAQKQNESDLEDYSPSTAKRSKMKDREKERNEQPTVKHENMTKKIEKKSKKNKKNNNGFRYEKSDSDVTDDNDEDNNANGLGPKSHTNDNNEEDDDDNDEDDDDDVDNDKHHDDDDDHENDDDDNDDDDDDDFE